MGLILFIAGLLLFLLTAYNTIGIILMVVGVILFFVPGPWYGYGYWQGRRPPP